MNFWTYFYEKLRWPLIHEPGPLQMLARGLATQLDSCREDMLTLRKQFIPAQCENPLVAEHGQSRGVVRSPRETDAQFRTRVVHAWGWHNLGGKVLGLPEILKFYGYEVARIENMRDFSPRRWAEFQIGLKSPASQQEQQEMLDGLNTFVWLVNEYKPARSFFFRIYTDVFDRRPIVLSVGPKLGDGWLSFFSGVALPGQDDADKDLIVSFGVRHGVQAKPYLEKELCGSFGNVLHLGFLAPYIDRFIVGRSRLSDVYPRNHGFTVIALFSILWADRATAGRRWRGRWDARRWLDYTGFDRKLPPWKMRSRGLSRSQLVPGHGEALSDNNARLGGTFATIVDNPPRLGECRLSDHDCQRRELRLHEMTLACTVLSVPPVEPATTIQTSWQFQTTGGSTERLFSVASGWKGKWDARRWRSESTCVQTAITSFTKE